VRGIQLSFGMKATLVVLLILATLMAFVMKIHRDQYMEQSRFDTYSILENHRRVKTTGLLEFHFDGANEKLIRCGNLSSGFCISKSRADILKSEFAKVENPCTRHTNDWLFNWNTNELCAFFPAPKAFLTPENISIAVSALRKIKAEQPYNAETRYRLYIVNCQNFDRFSKCRVSSQIQV
jgi:hypothetical protein